MTCTTFRDGANGRLPPPQAGAVRASDGSIGLSGRRQASSGLDCSGEVKRSFSDSHSSTETSMQPSVPAAAPSIPHVAAVSMPTVALIGYARRLLARRYHVPAQDVDDVIANAILDFILVGSSGRPCKDGLFLVIAQRRACDFWRAHRSELPLEAASRVACELDKDHLERRAIQERLLRTASVRSRLDTKRLLGIMRAIFAGASFAEACRQTAIPRGSQGHYRRFLRDFLCTTTVSPRTAASDGTPP